MGVITRSDMQKCQNIKKILENNENVRKSVFWRSEIHLWKISEIFISRVNNDKSQNSLVELKLYSDRFKISVFWSNYRIFLQNYGHMTKIVRFSSSFLIILFEFFEVLWKNVWNLPVFSWRGWNWPVGLIC